MRTVDNWEVIESILETRDIGLSQYHSKWKTQILTLDLPLPIPLIALLSQIQYIRNYFLCISSPMEQIECLKPFGQFHWSFGRLHFYLEPGAHTCPNGHKNGVENQRSYFKKYGHSINKSCNCTKWYING